MPQLHLGIVRTGQFPPKSGGQFKPKWGGQFYRNLQPKGKFRFRITNGFEGEAEKIMLTGKNTHLKMLKIKEETKQDSVAFKASYINKKESNNAVQKNKLSTGYNWGWLLVLLIIFALIGGIKTGAETKANSFCGGE